MEMRKKSEGKREMQPKVMGRSLKTARAPGDASKNTCSKMEWKGGKEHASHKYSK